MASIPEGKNLAIATLACALIALVVELPMVLWRRASIRKPHRSMAECRARAMSPYDDDLELTRGWLTLRIAQYLASGYQTVERTSLIFMAPERPQEPENVGLKALEIDKMWLFGSIQCRFDLVQSDHSGVCYLLAMNDMRRNVHIAEMIDTGYR